ncbi:carbohydrate sulfotransferase 11-like [Chiloscyllium plagiosum]|uniref:carbohydrate sulfotransferase 11-like n=1 Tax=Chiloscyllium plagiosum TaxID=36176 RepID=UPI001CB7F7A9|nr:carbohydrate sulfotransferase 11-like [Chiloscyllium plagiosum]
MRRSRAVRLAALTCLGSFLLLVLYFQGSFSPVTGRLVPTGAGGKGKGAGVRQRHNAEKFARSDAQQIHEHRRAMLNNNCAAHKLSRKRRILNAGDLRHLIVDDQHGLLYCYVPKVACTNWKRVMMVLTGAGRYTDPLTIPASEAHVASNLRTLDSYGTAEINHRLRNYLKFIFVREPFERLLSAYRNKFTRRYNTAFHKRYGTKIIREHRHNPSPEALERGADVTFQEFVWYLVDPKTRREEPFNEHWETVYSLCHPCLIHYDVVGHYETLLQDAHYLLDLVEPDHRVKFPSSNVSSRTTDHMTAMFFQKISPFYQRKLYKLYKLDFTLFNYSIPSYLSLH